MGTPDPREREGSRPSEPLEAPPAWTGWAASAVRRLGWRGTAVAVVVLGLLVLGLVLLAGDVAGYVGFVDALRGADAWWIAVVPFSEAVAYAGYVALFRAVAAFEGGPRLGRWLALRVVFASLGASRVVAAAGAGGLAVFYWVLRRSGAGRQEALVRILALSILVFGVLGVLAWGAALAVELGRGSAPAAMTLGWLAAGGPAILAGIAVGLFAHAGGRDRLGRLGVILDDVVLALRLVLRLVRRPAREWEAALGTAAYWGGDLVGLWASLRAFDVDLGASALVLAFATAYLATFLPLPGGGAGGVDAALTLALIWVGVPLGPALLAVLVYRFFDFLVPTLPGLAALGALPSLGRELGPVEGRASSASS